MKSNKIFFFLLALTAQQAILSSLTQSLSNVLISEYSEHTVQLSWRHVTFPKIDQLYQCWRSLENTLLQIDETRQCNRQHIFPGTSFFNILRWKVCRSSYHHQHHQQKPLYRPRSWQQEVKRQKKMVGAGVESESG